jgi:hypothetical protein
VSNVVGLQALVARGMQRSKDGCRPPAFFVFRFYHPRNGCEDISGVARPQGLGGGGEGWADPGETLESPCIAIAMQACRTGQHRLSIVRVSCTDSVIVKG